MTKHKAGYQEEQLSNKQIKDRATRSGIVLIVRQFVMRGLGVLGIFVLAKILTPEIFGIFAVLQFIIVLFEELGALGLPAALIRKEEPATHKQLSQVFSIQLLALLFSCLLVFFAAPLVTAHYELQESATLALQLMILALVFSALKSVPKIILQRSFRHVAIAKAEIWEYLVYLGLTISLALAGFGIWALVAGAITRSLVGMLMLHRFAGWPPTLSFDFSGLGKLFKFAVPIQLSKAVEIANNAILPVVVGSLFGVAAVGILNLARTLLDAAIAQPINMIGRVQFRLFGVMQSDSLRLRANIARSYLLGCCVAFALVAVLVSAIEPLIALLLDEKWAGVAPSLQVMAIGYGFYAVVNPAIQSIKAVGNAWLPLFAMLFWTVLGFSIIVLFADTLGALVYPVAIAISIPVGSFVLWIFSRALTGTSARREIIVPGFAAALACLPSFLGVWDAHEDWITVVAAPLVASFVYLTVLLLFLGSRISSLLQLLLEAKSGLPRFLATALEQFATIARKVSLLK